MLSPICRTKPTANIDCRAAFSDLWWARRLSTCLKQLCLDSTQSRTDQWLLTERSRSDLYGEPYGFDVLWRCCWRLEQMMYMALTYDHRILDGREAVTFLVKVCWHCWITLSRFVANCSCRLKNISRTPVVCSWVKGSQHCCLLVIRLLASLQHGTLCRLLSFVHGYFDQKQILLIAVSNSCSLRSA